jgi:hypothetical protein
MHSTEEQIWRLLRALEKVKGDAHAVALAESATDNLRRLVATGIFGSLEGAPLALMRTIEADGKSTASDKLIARTVLMALDAKSGWAQLSIPAISLRTGRSVSAVRASLRRLVAAEYFRAIPPSEKEYADGDHTMKYRPCLA